ncbi:MAG TPA: hypothetical protein VKP69_05935 [Isosphaeraceae bacterium]|nr:hypothetical protein [Isosphaeraceae bacterium]
MLSAPPLRRVVETDVLDTGDVDGIGATKGVEDLQPGIDEDLLARGQEVLPAPVVRAAGTATALAEPTRPSQRPALFDLLEDLLLVRQVELDVEGVLPIHDDRVALELGPVIDAQGNPGRLVASLDQHPDPKRPELRPDFLGDTSLEELAGLRGRCWGERVPVRIEHEDGMCRHAACSPFEVGEQA